MKERDSKDSSLYKLTVTATSQQDEYLVSHHSKMQPHKVRGAVGIIEAVGRYSSAVITSEPCYVQLPEDIQNIIESVRKVLIQRDEIMIKALVRSTQEIRNVIKQYPYL